MCNTPKNTTYALHVYHMCNTHAKHLVVYICTTTAILGIILKTILGVGAFVEDGDQILPFI